MVLKMWVENAAQFTKDFFENYDEDSYKRYFLEVDVQYLQKLDGLHNDLGILSEIIKTEKSQKTCSKTCVIKKNMRYTYKI